MSWFELDAEESRFLGVIQHEESKVMITSGLEIPPKIEIVSGPDLGVILIGVASILSSLVIGFFSYRVQRNQIRANAASLRNVWMEQLRVASAEFLQCVAIVVNLLDQDDFSPEDVAVMMSKKREALFLQIKIKLYVGTKSELAKGINVLSSGILVDVNSYKKGEFSSSDIREKLSLLENLVVDQIEKAWGQAKKDLSLPADK
ncbi:hypothetical protein [Pseudomonas guariconensis]|uniref:hypothetical protein n=1 Tax=Pseudomonas guariconensis TaxID=1288410 RepID=UPI00300CC537